MLNIIKAIRVKPTMTAIDRMKPDWLIRNPKRSFDMNLRRNMVNWVMSMCNFWIKKWPKNHVFK